MVNKRLLLAIIVLFVALPCLSYCQDDLDSAIGKLANKISQSMTEKNKTKIAVVPFQDLSSDTVTTFGKYLAEELTTALFESGKFNIVERNLLTRVLDELKLSKTGALDPNSAKELGKITGVDAVVTGTIQDLITRVAVNCRLIETETGDIFAAASEKIIKDESLAKILRERSQSSALPSQINRPSPNESLMSKAQTKGFAFQLVRCIRVSETAVACELLVTSEEKDQKLTIFAGIAAHYAAMFSEDPTSRLVDDNGHMCYATKVMLGEIESTWAVTNSLLSGVPVRAMLQFEGVRPKAKTLTLDIALSTDFSQFWIWRVAIKNIQISDSENSIGLAFSGARGS
jgi:TolB-like protein